MKQKTVEVGAHDLELLVKYVAKSLQGRVIVPEDLQQALDRCKLVLELENKNENNVQGG